MGINSSEYPQGHSWGVLTAGFESQISAPECQIVTFVPVAKSSSIFC